MTSILPPPERKRFKSQEDYKKAYNKWKKMFDYAIKNVYLDE